MELEDLLYFGFIIGSIIFSFLRKKKKEGKERSKTLSPAQRYAQYQTELSEKGEPEVRVKPIIAPTVQKEEARFAPKSDPLARSFGAKKPVPETKRKLIQDGSSAPRRELIFNMVRKKKPPVHFNLRDAIIYETILKRPKW